ncbi:unnamed protein product [Gordionus sp. m RMFG-2023]
MILALLTHHLYSSSFVPHHKVRENDPENLKDDANHEDLLIIPVGNSRVLHTKNGAIIGSTWKIGSRDSNFVMVEQFLGVSYASKPSQRFMPAGPPVKWRGLFNATRHGPICPQKVDQILWHEKEDKDIYNDSLWNRTKSGNYSFLTTRIENLISIMYTDGVVPNYDQNEDCLNLNIYLPSIKDKSLKYPVLVYLLLDSYNAGTGNTYDGKIMAAKHDIIVITLNLRLGIFGFLTTGDSIIRGNNGFLDLCAALQWIQENIINFGGDASQVTILGYNYGAALSNLLMVSPISKGKFKRIILIDGSIYSQPIKLRKPPYTTNLLLKIFNCTSPKNLQTNNGSSKIMSYTLAECLKKMEPSEILEITHKLHVGLIIWSPHIDNFVIPNIYQSRSDNKKLIKHDLNPDFNLMVGLINDCSLQKFRSYLKESLNINVLEDPEVSKSASSSRNNFVIWKQVVNRLVINNFFNHRKHIYAAIANEYLNWEKLYNLSQWNLMKDLKDVIKDFTLFAPTIKMLNLYSPSVSSMLWILDPLITNRPDKKSQNIFNYCPFSYSHLPYLLTAYPSMIRPNIFERLINKTFKTIFIAAGQNSSSNKTLTPEVVVIMNKILKANYYYSQMITDTISKFVKSGQNTDVKRSKRQFLNDSSANVSSINYDIISQRYISITKNGTIVDNHYEARRMALWNRFIPILNANEEPTISFTASKNKKMNENKKSKWLHDVKNNDEKDIDGNNFAAYEQILDMDLDYESDYRDSEFPPPPPLPPATIPSMVMEKIMRPHKLDKLIKEEPNQNSHYSVDDNLQYYNPTFSSHLQIPIFPFRNTPNGNNHNNRAVNYSLGLDEQMYLQNINGYKYFDDREYAKTRRLKYNSVLIITLGVGGSLLIINLLILGAVYHQRVKSYQYRVKRKVLIPHADNNCLYKSSQDDGKTVDDCICQYHKGCKDSCFKTSKSHKGSVEEDDLSFRPKKNGSVKKNFNRGNKKWKGKHKNDCSKLLCNNDNTNNNEFKKFKSSEASDTDIKRDTSDNKSGKFYNLGKTTASFTNASHKNDKSLFINNMSEFNLKNLKNDHDHEICTKSFNNDINHIWLVNPNKIGGSNQQKHQNYDNSKLSLHSFSDENIRRNIMSSKYESINSFDINNKYKSEYDVNFINEYLPSSSQSNTNIDISCDSTKNILDHDCNEIIWSDMVDNHMESNQIFKNANTSKIHCQKNSLPKNLNKYGSHPYEIYNNPYGLKSVYTTHFLNFSKSNSINTAEVSSIPEHQIPPPPASPLSSLYIGQNKKPKLLDYTLQSFSTNCKKNDFDKGLTRENLTQAKHNHDESSFVHRHPSKSLNTDNYKSDDDVNELYIFKTSSLRTEDSKCQTSMELKLSQISEKYSNNIISSSGIQEVQV